MKQERAVADTMQPRLLCVVPVRWPLSPSAQLATDTWLAECDGTLLAASRAQLAGRNVSSHRTANGERIRVVATHENHIDGKIDAWLPVRAAIAHASVQFIAEQTADWLVLAEDDAYISVVLLRIFLAQLDARKPHFLGACACGRAPGVNVFSAAAVHLHTQSLSSCPPDHRNDRYSRGLGCMCTDAGRLPILNLPLPAPRLL